MPCCDEANAQSGVACYDEGDPDDCEPGFVDRGFGCEPEECPEGQVGTPPNCESPSEGVVDGGNNGGLFNGGGDGGGGDGGGEDGGGGDGGGGDGGGGGNGGNEGNGNGEGNGGDGGEGGDDVPSEFG